MKILMIAYPFPPYWGMSQRTAFFANNLARKDHQVDVLAANPSKNFHGYDEGLVDLISSDVHVHRTYAGPFHHLRYGIKRILSKSGKQNKYLSPSIYSKIEKILSVLTSLEWFPIGLLKGYRLCKKNKYDVLYCHGDPYIANVIACTLKKIFNTPLVIYIGDPRYFGIYSKYKRVLKHLENVCLSNANRIVVNCPETLNGYLHYYPKISRGKYTVITDGFDENRFKEIVAEPGDKFRIVYTGTFYSSLREPLELIKAFARIGYDDVELVVAGEEAGEYQNSIEENRLAGKVKFLGYLTHDKVISLQKGATVLLLIGWAGGYQLPGKLFEYLAARRPIMVIRYDHADVAANMVARYKSGVVVNNDAEEIADAIEELYGLWKENMLDTSFSLNEKKEFTWENLSEELEDLFEMTVKN